MICLLNKIKKIICIDIMVWVCVISLFLQTVVVYALNSSDDSISKETIVENNTSSQSDDSIDISDIYENNLIKIYNTKQLQAIGSNSIVTSTDNDESNYGTGQQISVNDEYITYSLSSKYQLMKDISLNGNDIWTLPSDFTGTFNHGTVDENSTLYDSSTDTIYIYNDYQLKIIQSDNSENEPVMSQDMLPECVGMGQPVYSDNSSNYLTYSKSHNYVLSKNFTGEMPETKANQISNISTENCEGRDFNGQVVKTIGDKTYILIGNEEQLRKIGSDETVYGAVYQVYLHAANWYVDEDENGNPIMLYGGDADLKKSQNGNANFEFGKNNIHDKDKKQSKYSLYPYVWGRCGVNQSTGEIDPTLDIDKATNQKYSTNANYIIFRNIDLSSDNWTPLMFQGTMIGSKGDGKSTLWNNDTSVIDYSKATDLNIGEKPVISNVNVSQTSELDVGKQMGVGFFATLSNEASSSDLGLSKGTVTVKNLKFNNITVDNETTKTKFDQTLINGLIRTLGSTLGALLDGLTWLLTFGSVDAGLTKTLSSILNARKNDPTALATGCFAGRVVGDVAISDCELDDVKVTNVNSNTGGFIGYISGKTEYDGLSKGLGGTATLLAKILNVIPGLGLGDLITILLGNAIPVDKLIPTKYINAYVENCSINNLTGNIGTNNDKIENSGGFIGQQKGTVVKDCQITNSNFNVKANNYSGGFVGLARDDVIEGTLSGALDIETQLPKMNPENLFLNCSVSASDLTISGNGYQGGFAGAMANTSAINCNVNVSDKLTVSSGGDNSGGFAGIATIGWVADLGKGDTKDNLLGGVVDLVVKLLSSNQNATSSLLSLAGVSPSHILGCQINAPCSVEGKNYTGGLIGRGDGVYLTKSNTDNLSKVSYFKNNIFSMDGLEEKNIIINGLKSVDGENCVGGISGSVGTASVAGLLNTTLGVAEYLGFNANSISLTGSTEGITIGGKGKRVGGAFGEAIGGSISSVTVTNLNNISGENIVGGFIGVSGPGDLAGTDNGLTVNLLGLNYILKLSSLLSLGQAVEVNIDSSSVSGINSGFTVEATGSREDNSTTDYVAAGFVAKSNSTKINDAKVNNLKTVTSTDDGGYSGGFIGISKTGGLAEVGDETEIKKLISANGLLNAVGYLIPSYQQCYVSYVDNGGVRGDIAGGFVGDFQSGIVENDENNAYAIQNISYVKGKTYAGGFGGKVYSGALADSTKGISILGGLADLNIQISDLLSLIQVYIPIIKNAGVQSNGLVVSCDTYKSTDLNSGSAGGYIGYGSAVRVSNSSVTKLKHTTVKTPNANINDTDSSSYFGESSSYAISAPKNAGGYVGKLDIGSTASVGGGLKALGTNINLANILSALDVTASKIENSDVTGAVGGFSVKANGLDENKTIGNAGGFVGTDYGSQIQNSNVNNFSYIIGQETAGGYAGNIQPGSVADVLGKTEILKGLISVDSLTSVLQSFIPMIYNSQTTCIPCGGAVRADAISNESLKGCAGGYVGYNLGGRIEGNSTRKWNGEIPTVQKECAVYRLRAVYGYEYAGGFSGRTDCANTVDTGNISVLYGLINLDNPLSALSAVYPTETNTATYGPLRGLTTEVWNSWVKAVGVNGAYGKKFQELGEVDNQDELDKIIDQYAYGYEVKAGRTNAGSNDYQGGIAGGYVGQMNGGEVTFANARDLKDVTALKSSGGFAGEMISAGVANVGDINLGNKLNVVGSLPILQSFIPVVKTSSVTGFQSGATISTTGTDFDNDEGNSGGFVGKVVGGKIEGTQDQYCLADQLKVINGSQNVGGFAGNIQPGSAVTLNTSSNTGLLSKLLKYLLGNAGDLAKVLNATLSIVDYAKVDAWNDYGLSVNGSYTLENDETTKYAKQVGGFVGNAGGAIFGDKDATSVRVEVNNIRNVVGGRDVGGFFGLADVSSVAQVGNDDSDQILNLIKLGNIDVLDAFRTYVYQAKVTGSNDNGLSVCANDESQEGTLDSKVQTGNAGGFGGSLLDGSIKNSSVTGLNKVKAKNYAGGFVGHMGKSGVVDLDEAGVGTGKLLNATAGVLDIFGSHSDNCSVIGIPVGFTISSESGKEPISGGFVGYADLGRMSNCNVENIKKVASDQIAGGFVGKTSFEYLANIDLGSSYLLDPILSIVNKLLDILYVGDLENVGLIDINLGSLLKLQVLAKGNALSVTLLGLTISVVLDKDRGDGTSDLAKITIGDSYIEIPCSNIDGNHIADSEKENIKVGLIKSNRTKVDGCSITGIHDGYDVFGGKANDSHDGSEENGQAGGFIGYNNEGLIENNEMYLADTIRGTSNQIGPFSGTTSLNSSYDFNTKKNIEGKDNTYRIYRTRSDSLIDIIKNSSLYSKKDSDFDNWNIFKIRHYDKVQKYDDLKDAKLSDESKSETVDLNAYVSPAKAVLMDDTEVSDNEDGTTPIPSDTQDPCNEKINITINKLWKDLSDKQKERPDTITVTLTRTYMKGSEEILEKVGDYTLSANDVTDSKNTWQTIIKGLDAYTTLDDGSKAYYTYSVTESEVENYITSIEESDDGYTFTITNKDMPLLPNLGGKGTMLFVLVGIVGALAVLLSYKKSKKAKNIKE